MLDGHSDRRTRRERESDFGDSEADQLRTSKDGGALEGSVVGSAAAEAKGFRRRSSALFSLAGPHTVSSLTLLWKDTTFLLSL